MSDILSRNSPEQVDYKSNSKTHLLLTLLSCVPYGVTLRDLKSRKQAEEN